MARITEDLPAPLFPSHTIRQPLAIVCPYHVLELVRRPLVDRLVKENVFVKEAALTVRQTPPRPKSEESIDG